MCDSILSKSTEKKEGFHQVNRKGRAWEKVPRKLMNSLKHHIEGKVEYKRALEILNETEMTLRKLNQFLSEGLKDPATNEIVLTSWDFNFMLLQFLLEGKIQKRKKQVNSLLETFYYEVFRGLRQMAEYLIEKAQDDQKVELKIHSLRLNEQIEVTYKFTK